MLIERLNLTFFISCYNKFKFFFLELNSALPTTTNWMFVTSEALTLSKKNLWVGKKLMNARIGEHKSDWSDVWKIYIYICKIFHVLCMFFFVILIVSSFFAPCKVLLVGGDQLKNTRAHWHVEWKENENCLKFNQSRNLFDVRILLPIYLVRFWSDKFNPFVAIQAHDARSEMWENRDLTVLREKNNLAIVAKQTKKIFCVWGMN